MSTFITTIDGRKCTARPKAKGIGGGQAATTAVEPPSPPATTSISNDEHPTTTTLETSSTPDPPPAAPPVIPPVESTTTAVPDAGGVGNINAPVLETTTSAEAQETLTTSTTSFTSSSSSQSEIPTSTSEKVAPETPSPETPPTTSALNAENPIESESLVASSSDSPKLDTSISASQTAALDLGSATPTDDLLAPTPTFDAGLGAPSDTLATLTATTTTTGAEQIESGDAGSGLTNGAQNNVSNNAISTQTTVAVAGGVIGGLALLSIIAFLFWFWRKRQMKKRRSTLLTPLESGGRGGSGGRSGEKSPTYVISRDSLGPTSFPDKVKATVGYSYHRIRGRVNSIVTRGSVPSVDLNRGNSQYGLPDPATSRASRGAATGTGDATTIKDRISGWWTRLTGDRWKPNYGLEGGKSNNEKFGGAQSRNQGGQPDFRTLLAMDDEQQRGAFRDPARSSGNPRRSQSLGNGHFLGGLRLNFDGEDPFSDVNAMSHDSAKVKPLTVGATNAAQDPFSDSNAVSKPADYVQNVRRSRNRSLGAVSAVSSLSSRYSGRVPSMYRVSRVSVDTTDTRHNKYRSDPFDLDTPELYVQSPEPVPGSSPPRPAGPLPDMPRPTHSRNGSRASVSNYSSGVSSSMMGDWSDPGPDVGPAAERWNTPSPDGALGRMGSERGKQPSVGKAV